MDTNHDSGADPNCHRNRHGHHFPTRYADHREYFDAVAHADIDGPARELTGIHGYSDGDVHASDHPDGNQFPHSHTDAHADQHKDRYIDLHTHQHLDAVAHADIDGHTGECADGHRHPHTVAVHRTDDHPVWDEHTDRPANLVARTEQYGDRTADRDGHGHGIRNRNEHHGKYSIPHESANAHRLGTSADEYRNRYGNRAAGSNRDGYRRGHRHKHITGTSKRDEHSDRDPVSARGNLDADPRVDSYPLTLDRLRRRLQPQYDGHRR